MLLSCYHYTLILIKRKILFFKSILRHDALMVAKQLNISESQIRFDRMEADAAADAIEDSSKDSLSEGWLKRTLKCVTKEDVLKRILRKLQIRGVVSWRVSLHLSDSAVKDMNLSSFIHLLTKERQAFFNKTELKMQKKQAYHEAWNQLSLRQISKVEEIYQLDNEMFAFGDVVKEHFKHRNLTHTEAFQYQKPWDLSKLFR